MPRWWCWFLLVWVSFSFGQQPPQPPVGGVFIDADGVARLREGSAKRRRSADDASSDRRGRVSLAAVFREAKEAPIRSLPTEIRFLEGLVRVDRVVLDRDTADVWLEGPADQIVAADDQRWATGKQSGRPTLRLEDLVLLLQLADKLGAMPTIGCSIDLSPEAPERMAQATGGSALAAGFSEQRLLSAMAQAAGEQTVRYFGVNGDDPVAHICLAADLRLKRLALGLDASPIRFVKSHLSMAKEREAVYNRWWFVADYEPIAVSDDETQFDLSGPRLKVLASDSPMEASRASKSAQRFTTLLNENMEALGDADPWIGGLQNLTDLAVVAALVTEPNIEWKTEWTFWPNCRSVVVDKVPAANRVEPLVNLVKRSRAVQVAAGGVRITASDVIRQRRPRTSETEKGS